MFSFFKKNKNLLEKNILVFVGSPRTGSTLLGQIINYHPNCLISNESNFVKRVVQENKKIENVLNDIYNEAQKQFNNSLENDKKYGKTINRYQPKWKDMQYLTDDIDFKKEQILYLGDKKAGGVSKVFKEFPEKTTEFFNHNDKIKVIQIIRNPINAAKSLMKSHNVKNFEDACKEIIEMTDIADQLIKKVKNPSLQIYYEDLLQNPKEEIKKVIEFLALETKESWIEKISSIVTSKDNSGFSEDEIKTMNNIILEQNTDILKKYQY